MKANARGVIEGTKLGLGKALVTAQIALSLLLVVGAALMLSTFWKLISQDAGFDGGHVLLYTIEGILRRPLSRRAMQVAHAIGLSLVLTIFLYASYQDVLRWRLGFWK